MEKQLSFVLKLSLQEMALRKVAINLWNENDILTSIVNFRISALPGDDFADIILYMEKRGTLNKKLQQIVEDEVKNKVVKLALPQSLQKQLMRIIKPVGSQMLKWKMSFHNEHMIDSPEDFDIDILKQLHWTSVGVVDYQKTAENLVRHEMLNPHNRYKLACLYSLVDYIPELWKELPEESKAIFYSDVVLRSNLELQLSSYWAYIVTAKESELCNIFAKRYGEGMSFHQYAFRCAAREGNRAITEYFFQKLTREERDVHFLRTVRKIIRKGRRYLNKEFLDFAMEKLSDVLTLYLPVAVRTYYAISPPAQLPLSCERQLNFFQGMLNWWKT
ncbi:uncharacterized protein LOC129957093 [Argiope bruennichi]|uniref:uncharacterized protein LOC129957093 n=1 Tax=Argiope bruennichi TaxID=94029 RepID=UPI0024943F13|nr:uncharacterized protein LOC129957093 [Argiope bruennichi]XP_055925212.1 uncharacterized protein LOC129957093 [Argiope bruennichi]